VVVVLLGAQARAEPEAVVRDRVERDGIEPKLETSLRMRSDGAAAGVGVGARWVHGDYALSLGLMRWQTLDMGDGSKGSWELGVRGYRYLQVGPNTRAYLMANAGYERIERDGTSFDRTNLAVGAGLSTKLADGLVGWAQLTLEHRHWLDLPSGVGNSDELAVMLMFGLSF
jgi:hypothetical protein